MKNISLLISKIHKSNIPQIATIDETANVISVNGNPVNGQELETWKRAARVKYPTIGPIIIRIA